MSFVVHVRRAAELDIAGAQLWYETQRNALGTEFLSEVSLVIDRLAETPLIYQAVYRDVRRAIVYRFPYLIWYRVLGKEVTVLACTPTGSEQVCLSATMTSLVARSFIWRVARDSQKNKGRRVFQLCAPRDWHSVLGLLQH